MTPKLSQGSESPDAPMTSLGKAAKPANLLSGPAGGDTSSPPACLQRLSAWEVHLYPDWFHRQSVSHGLAFPVHPEAAVLVETLPILLKLTVSRPRSSDFV